MPSGLFYGSQGSHDQDLENLTSNHLNHMNMICSPSSVNTWYTLWLKKVPTFKLHVTLSNLDQFSHICTAGKRTKFATKIVSHYRPHCRHVATLPWENKNSYFLQIFNRYGRKCEQIVFQVHRLSFPYACSCIIWVYLCVFINILFLSLNTILIFDKHCCDELLARQIDRNIKQVKRTVTYFICNHYGEIR